VYKYGTPAGGLPSYVGRTKDDERTVDVIEAETKTAFNYAVVSNPRILRRAAEPDQATLPAREIYMKTRGL